MRRSLRFLLLSGSLLAVPAIAEPLWIHLRITDDDGRGQVRINLPASAADRATAALPTLRAHHCRIEVDGSRFERKDLGVLWPALSAAAEEETVEVATEEGNLSARKVAGRALIEVRDGFDGPVTIDMPLSMLEVLARAGTDVIPLRELLSIVLAEGSTPLTVVSGDSAVRMWVDAIPAGKE